MTIIPLAFGIFQLLMAFHGGGFSAAIGGDLAARPLVVSKWVTWIQLEFFGVLLDFYMHEDLLQSQGDDLQQLHDSIYQDYQFVSSFNSVSDRLARKIVRDLAGRAQFKPVEKRVNTAEGVVTATTECLFEVLLAGPLIFLALDYAGGLSGGVYYDGLACLHPDPLSSAALLMGSEARERGTGKIIYGFMTCTGYRPVCIAGLLGDLAVLLPSRPAEQWGVILYFFVMILWAAASGGVVETKRKGDGHGWIVKVLELVHNMTQYILAYVSQRWYFTPYVDDQKIDLPQIFLVAEATWNLFRLSLSL
ncbi:hypothetical protein AK812_SmicGene15422 [Symbiodinium microadriaticum]|uniref:Uncharacterized protein n=1 Tax=Symbiodinium microadriaticum TaxID=2951 RepID=A0A1Q9E2Z4_SYMMI|nr:hypothetical protein AK812_SmicGene15422 [Symbiodinium microadriaticum]